MSEAPSDRPGTVEVTYLASDLVVLNGLVWRFWAVLLGIVAAALVLLCVGFPVLNGYSFSDAVQWTDWIYLIEVLAALVAWTIFVLTMKYLWSRHKGRNGPIRFDFRSDGLGVENREMSAVVFWSAIRKVRVHRNRLFLFVTTRSALILPRRSFDDQQSFESCIDQATRLWTKNSGRA